MRQRDERRKRFQKEREEREKLRRERTKYKTCNCSDKAPYMEKRNCAWPDLNRCTNCEDPYTGCLTLQFRDTCPVIECHNPVPPSPPQPPPNKNSSVLIGVCVSASIFVSVLIFLCLYTKRNEIRSTLTQTRDRLIRGPRSRRFSNESTLTTTTAIELQPMNTGSPQTLDTGSPQTLDTGSPQTLDTDSLPTKDKLSLSDCIEAEEDDYGILRKGKRSGKSLNNVKP